MHGDREKKCRPNDATINQVGKIINQGSPEWESKRRGHLGQLQQKKNGTAEQQLSS